MFVVMHTEGSVEILALSVFPEGKRRHNARCENALAM